MVPLALGKTCSACGQERKSKGLRYDTKNFNAYCDNPYICNDEHPNSVKNLIANQRETVLIPYTEAVEAYRKHLSEVYKSSDIVQRIHRLLTQPVTIRIQDPDMAKFLVELQAEKDADMSETIRNCIQIVMDNKGMFLTEHRAAQSKQEREQRTAEVLASVEKEPEQPKPVPQPATGGDLGTF